MDKPFAEAKGCPDLPKQIVEGGFQLNRTSVIAEAVYTPMAPEVFLA